MKNSTDKKTDRYLEATRLVPAGETRTYAQLAALAGNPAAARAAGRAIAACAIDAPFPWHRIVSSDGSLARDPRRAKVQAQRLRAEGALAADSGKVAPRTAAPERKRRSAPRAAPVAKGSRETTPSEGPPRESPPRESIGARLDAIDWPVAVAGLRERGVFVSPGLLAPAECEALTGLWTDAARFERTIEMGPRGYGVGVYRYFAEPLPEPAASVRAEIYERVRGLASEAPGAVAYPPTLAEFWDRCRASGQPRASSILLRYGEGGVNFPHRDIYGKQWFPYQAVIVLSRRGADFDGGDFVLHAEEGERVAAERAFGLDQGDLCVFASRGFHGSRGGRPRWIEQRHGMRPVTRGERFALGLVLHLAE